MYLFLRWLISWAFFKTDCSTIQEQDTKKTIDQLEESRSKMEVNTHTHTYIYIYIYIYIYCIYTLHLAWGSHSGPLKCEGEAVEQTDRQPVSSAGFILIQTVTLAQCFSSRQLPHADTWDTNGAALRSFQSLSLSLSLSLTHAHTHTHTHTHLVYNHAYCS